MHIEQHCGELTGIHETLQLVRDDYIKRRGLNAALIILSTVAGNGIILLATPFLAKLIH